MDYEYLLWLQDLRDGFFGGALDDFGNWLCNLNVSPWPLMAAALVYWLINKRGGCYWFMNFALSYLANVLIKLSFCIYRPWFIDSRIQPAGNLKSTTSGYSFPSGHTTLALSIYGPLSVWQWKSRKWLSILAVVPILLTLFYRNFLGVHTPQDVVVGFICTIITMFLSYKLFEYLEKKNKKAHTIMLIITFVVSILIWLYITFKPYPMDYIDGKIIADPAKGIADGYECLGMLLGFAIAWFIERHYVNFQVPNINIKKSKKAILIILLAIIATVPVYFVHQNLGAAISPVVGSLWAKFIPKFIEFVYILVIVPIIYNLITIRKVKNPIQER